MYTSLLGMDVTAICNSGSMDDGDKNSHNTHITIEARDDDKCPHQYEATCIFAYFAKAGHTTPGRAGSKPGITFNANVLGTNFTKTIGLRNGGKEVSLTYVGSVTKVICLTPSWQKLFISRPSITAGTRDMSGKWLGAWLEEVFAASCTLTKLPSCCNQ